MHQIMGLLCGGAFGKKLSSSGGEGRPLRSLYTDFFIHCNLLPDAVGKQNPFILLKMLSDLSEDDDDRLYTSGHLRMLYGE